MRRNWTRIVLGGLLTATTALVGCTSGNSGTRTVQIDYPHDDFAAAFNAYFPKKVSVHPGDKVRFVNTWTGEPHSVTLGRVVDKIFEYTAIFDQYDSEEAARAGGVSDEVIDDINTTFTRIPGMTKNGYEVYQQGAKPCFITRLADVPAYSDESGNASDDPATKCSAKNSRQPAFTGRQALYNSGFIPFNGDDANVFEVPIAADATPGEYNYFCTYHWLDMSGQITIAKPATEVPSATDVIRQARREIEAMEKPLATEVAKAKKGDFGRLKDPVAGLPRHDEDYAWVNEFLPNKIKAKVGEPVTWTVYGAAHTISFNVPSYFPVFSVAANGDIESDARVDKPVGWKVPEPPDSDEGPPPPRVVDVGTWNGAAKFHSSGLLFDGDTFTLTFAKPGTYPYACLLHPPMIGTVEVSP